jgi:hypothetical protein
MAESRATRAFQLIERFVEGEEEEEVVFFIRERIYRIPSIPSTKSNNKHDFVIAKREGFLNEVCVPVRWIYPTG